MNKISQVKKKRDKKLWVRKIRSKFKKKLSRRNSNGLNQFDRDQLNYKKKNWDAERIVAPRNFSFVENTNEIVKFINKLESCYKDRKKVFVVLRNIDNLNYDALVVLLSVMIKFKTKKIKFNGDFPKNKKAFEILRHSGFFELIYFEFLKYKDSYDFLGQNSIYTHANKIVDSVLGAKIIASASKTIWGKRRRCQGVQKTFLELMLNTNNHADVEMEGVKHWWLSVFHFREERKVAFSFVDFGVGVFNSLDKKTTRSKWYGWMQLLAASFSFTNNADILKLILEGKLHTTVTKEPFRGNGLPGLKLALDRNQISNLHIITNNVKANVKNGTYEIINQNFSGTFVYWELNQNNLNCDGNA